MLATGSNISASRALNHLNSIIILQQDVTFSVFFPNMNTKDNFSLKNNAKISMKIKEKKHEK
uniref:Uncharacterized protein n=1 Tax=uncultured Desulfobacterium sp. TaxID=201089 RepID=E1Y9I7_9BACT|nr:unknown protein [uncultured Desulfobacterium sp.]